MTKFSDFTAIRKIYSDDERGVEEVAIAMLGNDATLAEMGWPAIDVIRRQFRLGAAIADLVVTHNDRSITVIEVKRHGLALRDYCTGIGQLAYQGFMAMDVFRTLEVRRVLAAPGPIPLDVVIACEVAGVDILPLPTPDQMALSIWEAVQKRAAETN